MVFLSLRWLITTAMYNAALLYAAYLAMRPTNTDAPSSPGVTGKEKLKLWMILATVTAISDTFGFSVCSWIPLFYEMRALFVWCLILLEPTAWCRFYDVVLSPTALKLLSAFHDLKSSMVVRRAVHTSVTCASSLFIVLLEVAVSTGALDKATAELEDTILPWHERIARFDINSVSSASLRASVADLVVVDRTLEDTTSIGDEMRTLTQRTIDKNKLAFAAEMGSTE
jgi:hypothetical protein